MPSSAAAARPYARALWELARERGAVEAVARDLAAAVALVEGQPQLQDVFARPWVAAAAKRQVALEVAARLGLSPLARDFLGLVARQGRADQLPAIARTFRELGDAEAGRIRARVRTAVPLTGDERLDLQRRLARALGAREVVLEETVDPALLGGFVAEVGSYVVDGSLDGQLARLRDRLARG